MKTKKIINIILIFSLLVIAKFEIKAEFEVSDFNMNSQYLLDVDIKGETIYVVSAVDVGTEWNNAKINYFNGEKWEEIPSNISNANYSGNIEIKRAQIRVGKNGELWVLGHYLYHYKDGKWSEHIINDEFAKLRTFTYLDLDSEGNPWVCTSIFRKGVPYYGASELLKFENNEFKEILTTKYDGSFVHSSLNMIGNSALLYRSWHKEIDEDYESENHNDLLLVNEDGSIIGNKLKTEAEFEAIKYPRNIRVISENEYWVCNDYTYWGKADVSDYCCSGLSLFKDNKWIVFDKSNNYPYKMKNGSNLPIPADEILKLSDDKYLVFISNRVYSFGSDYILEEIEWKTIIDNSIFIPSNDYFTLEQSLKSFETYINPKPGGGGAPVKKAIALGDNSFCIQFNRGLLILNKSVLSVENTKAKLTKISPNPVEDNIKIDSKLNFISYEIIGLDGTIILSGDYQSSISALNLSSGMYFLRLKDVHSKNHTIKFIKK